MTDFAIRNQTDHNLMTWESLLQGHSRHIFHFTAGLTL